jgi:hypothetical protein
MRRRPNICDACVRVEKRSNPEARSSLDRWIPHCEAFPAKIPDEIYFGGFDHRQPYPGDNDIRFQLREGGERQLAAYEQRLERQRGRDAESKAGELRDGPIQPLAGEPPITLFGTTEEVELPAGTQIDRFGPPSGNVTYVAGTDYANRSLPKDWSERPYHVYRVERPLRALTGKTVPWFDQPGGGTAYILPVAIADLLTDGSLSEVR